MPVTFPAIRPTDRRLVPGTVPQSVTRAINGRTVRRPMASHQGGMRLEVTFENVRDDQVEAIRQVRNAAKADPVLLPDELFAGDPELLVFVKFLPPDTAWRFSGDVEVEWAKRGRATVRVVFVNYRRTLLSLPPPPEVEVPPVTGVTACARMSEITPTPTGQSDALAAYSPDGQRVYLMAKTPAVPDTRYHFGLAAFDATGNLLWAAEDTSRDVHPYGTMSGFAVLPNGDIVACFFYGTTTHKLYRFTSAGALLVSRSFQGQSVPGSITAATRVLYVAAIDKIAVDFDGPGVFLYDPLTLAPSGQVRSTRQMQQTTSLLWTAGNSRFIATGRDGNDMALFEFSADLGTTHQKYLYLTSALPKIVPYLTWAVDVFGAVYGLYAENGTSGGLYVLKLSASAGGFLPLKVAFIPFGTEVIAYSPSINKLRIDIKPDGTVLILHGGLVGATGITLLVWEISADLTAVIGRTVATLSRPSGATETGFSDATDTSYKPDWSSIVTSVWRMSPLQIPLDIPPNNEITFTAASHGTVRVYREKLNRAITDRPDLLPARNVNGYGTIVPTNTEVSQPPTMADLTARYSWNALGQCKTFAEVWGFGVSETTTTGASLTIGGGNRLYHQTLVTAAGAAMTIAYPTIRPTDLTLTLARLPIATHGWQGVWEAPVLAGSLPVDARLDLSYRNITTADAAALLVCWRTSGSGLFALNALPPEVVAGVVNADLAAWIRQPTGLKWTWAEAPRHEAVKSHRATVTVRLRAELR